MTDLLARLEAAEAGSREPKPLSNARLVAELQAVALAIRIAGLDQLPEVYRPAPPEGGE